jgi:hypothetical protein
VKRTARPTVPSWVGRVTACPERSRMGARRLVAFVIQISLLSEFVFIRFVGG